MSSSCFLGAAVADLEFSAIHLQIAELYLRGWNADELGGLASGNFLRVFAAAEDVAREMAREGIAPAQDLYEKRVDIAWK